MTRLSARDRMLRAVTEAELEKMVTSLARAAGWMAHHERRSTYSTGDQGFPDWVFARTGRLVFAELKRQTETPWEPQRRWLQMLEAGPAEVYVWRPSDWYDGEIAKVLT